MEANHDARLQALKTDLKARIDATEEEAVLLEIQQMLYAPELTEAQERELEHRLAHFKEAKHAPSEEVYARLRSRIPKS